MGNKIEVDGFQRLLKENVHSNKQLGYLQAISRVGAAFAVT